MLCCNGKMIRRILQNALMAVLLVAVSASFIATAYARGENDTEEAELITSDTTEILFEDVVGHWAEGYVNAAAKRQLFKGDANGKFNPDASITRAQFVTVLWRMAGAPVADIETPFTDITNQTEELRSAIEWAYKNGYIDGISPILFAPSDSLTREAAIKILYLYSGDQSGEFLKFSFVYEKTFSDGKDISQWAIKPMYWGLYNELIAGTNATTLNPKGMITRAQLAKIMMKYIEISQQEEM